MRYTATSLATSIGIYEAYTEAIPNCLGCFLMALIGGNATLVKKYPIMSKAFTTGFCGSFTTFSSWIYAIAGAGSYANAAEETISGFCMPMMFFIFGKELITILSYCLAISELQAGQNASAPIGGSNMDDEKLAVTTRERGHTVSHRMSNRESMPDIDETIRRDNDVELNDTKVFEMNVKQISRITSSAPTSHTKREAFEMTTESTASSHHCTKPSLPWIDLVSSGILVAAFVLTFVVVSDVVAVSTTTGYDGPAVKYLWYCLWGPVGAISRFFLANKYNVNGSKLGTVYANVAAVVLYGILTQINTATNGDYYGDFAAIQGGLCGSLSTVSSFVADTMALRETSKMQQDSDQSDTVDELDKFKTFMLPYVYYIGSITACLCIASLLLFDI